MQEDNEKLVANENLLANANILAKEIWRNLLSFSNYLLCHINTIEYR